jgi:hypothetical protein
MSKNKFGEIGFWVVYSISHTMLPNAGSFGML